MTLTSFRVGRRNTATPKTGKKKAGYSLNLSWNFQKRNLPAGRKNKNYLDLLNVKCNGNRNVIVV